MSEGEDIGQLSGSKAVDGILLVLFSVIFGITFLRDSVGPFSNGMNRRMAAAFLASSVFWVTLLTLVLGFFDAGPLVYLP